MAPVAGEWATVETAIGRRLGRVSRRDRMPCPRSPGKWIPCVVVQFFDEQGKLTGGGCFPAPK